MLLHFVFNDNFFLILLFQKQNKKIFVAFYSCFTICFSIIFNINNQVKVNFTNFFNQISKMTTIVIEMVLIINPQYLREFTNF